MRNLRLAFRALWKTPFVTAVAVLSLALGIGANAAIYGLFDQMLLRPLPVAEPNRLVNLSNPGPKPGSQSCNQAGDCDVVFSYAMFRDLEKSQDVLTGLAGHVAVGANLALRGQTPVSGTAMLVSGSYFPVLGIQPAVGRLFAPNDDETIGANFVAVLSHRYWQDHLGGDPRVIGQTVVANGQALTIVGVAPRGFDGTTLGTQPELFVPLSMRAQMVPGWTGFENRRKYWIYLFGRLKPGVSLEQAATRLNAIYHPIVTDVEAPLQTGMSDQTLTRFKAKSLMLEDGRRGQSSMHRETRAPLIFLFGITGLVLLIACANIANLLLARGAQRSGEVAVRLALGATRMQLLRQLLTESVMLALMGGLAGLLVAQWTLAGIRALLPPDSSTLVHFGLEPSVLVFAGLLSLATGVLFGMFPALHSTRSDLISSIRANAGQLAGARAAARFRTGLVVAQIALSMALLVGAGLFIRSLANVSRVDLGLKTDHVVTFGVSPELNGYSNQRSRQFFDRLEEELAAIPGVQGVTAARVPLIAGNNWGNDVSVEGFKKDPDTDDNSRFNEIGTGYFQTLQVDLLGGRPFSTADAAGAPKVAIVNEAFAKKFGLGKDAVGKHMSQGGNVLDIEIVGLARNAKYSQVKDEIPPVFFIPYRQDTTVGSVSFYVRSALDPESLLRTIPTVVARIDPNMPVEELKTLPEQVRENFFLDRMLSTLSAAFALLATLLAAVGVYGVLAYTVTLRTREIGVRLALGADETRVRGMVLRQVGRMTLIGGLIGLVAAVAIGRTLRSLLYGLAGHDPVVLAVAMTVL
ncbi:MAG TPA: ABC transporter permease, partial [Gemmatimonadales bacterium]|nr:ABC transporter permease [Gemmatimonadales bacterium]